MPLTFDCERCGRRYSLDESLAGRHGRCKACNHPFTVPGGAAPAAPEAPALPRGRPPRGPRPALAPVSSRGGKVWAWAAGAAAAVVLVLACLGPSGRLAAVGLTSLIGTVLVFEGAVGALIRACRESMIAACFTCSCRSYSLY